MLNRQGNVEGGVRAGAIMAALLLTLAGGLRANQGTGASATGGSGAGDPATGSIQQDGDNDVAAGTGSLAGSGTSTAIGEGAQAGANGSGATAIGSGASATNINSTAVGLGAQATENYGVAVGAGSGASAIDATALGDSASAGNSGATAIGQSAVASGVTAPPPAVPRRPREATARLQERTAWWSPRRPTEPPRVFPA